MANWSASCQLSVLNSTFLNNVTICSYLPWRAPIGEVVNQLNIQTLWKKVVMKYYGGPHDMVISYEGPTILTAYCKSSSGNKGHMVIMFPCEKLAFNISVLFFKALTS